MARQVYGNITDKTSPLSKLVVEAWDSNPDGDDFMGRVAADKAGDYRIECAEGHWDPAAHEITTWRPDIYIRVLTKTKNGRDVEVARSKVYDNQPLRDDRKINLNVGVNGTIAVTTPFKADAHGLPFPIFQCARNHDLATSPLFHGGISKPLGSSRFTQKSPTWATVGGSVHAGLRATCVD